MEVEVSTKYDKQIDVAAGVAMVEWECLFSTELFANAKAIASQAGADLVTLDHLRDAAGPAVEAIADN